MTFGYADPPYPGKENYYPERRPVDHAKLIAALVGEFPDGWALSTSSEALQAVLQLCPPGVRVCPWVRRARHVKSTSAIRAWEPLIVWRGRLLDCSGTQRLTDVLIEKGRLFGYPGAMTGMKPPAFAVWMFQLLGAQRGDQLVDLFPGSGAVSRAWRRFSAEHDASAGNPRHVARGHATRSPRDASRAAAGRLGVATSSATRPEVLRDTSPARAATRLRSKSSRLQRGLITFPVEVS